MGKWTTRHDNRRRLSQAANLIDNAIDHLMIIEKSYPDEYTQHKELLQALAVGLDHLKRETLSYRERI